MLRRLLRASGPAAALALVLPALLLGRSQAAGQSFLSVGGLGVPTEGLDARARALGSVGVGLSGYSVLAFDPTGSAGVPGPFLQGSVQPSWGVLPGAEGDATFHVTRFPHLGLAYPVGATATAFVNYSGFLDQRWQIVQERTENLGGSQVRIRDEFVSDGGAAVLQVGWAQTLGDRWAVGISGGLYTGSLRRSLTRTFEAGDIGTDIDPYIVRGDWTLSGPTATLGVRWDPIQILRLAGSVTWSGDLEVEPGDETERGGETLGLPMTFRLGGTADLTNTLALTAGFSYADWERGGSGLSASAAGGARYALGTGLEYTGAEIFNREFPIRLGFRTTDYPFTFDGEAVKENLFSGGVGYVFVAQEDYPLALVDLAVERGRRSAGPEEESFWRATVTLRLSGG